MSGRSTMAGTRSEGSGTEAVLTRYRFDVDDYYAMARAGILTEDDRVELLDGEVVEMTPIGVPHAICVNRLTRLFSQRFADGALVQVQNPVRLGRYSEPEPDVALLKLPLERYAAGHPTPEDVLLLVEVADTSLLKDRLAKLPLYAEAGVVEVWLVNLGDREIEVYRDPSDSSYGEVRRVDDGTVSPLAFPDEAVGVEEILGPPDEGNDPGA